MVRAGIVKAALALLLILAVLWSATAVSPAQERAVPPPVSPAPFSPQVAGQRSLAAVVFIPASRMSGTDRLLAGNAAPSIAGHAARSGFDLGHGAWTHEQIVCRALPGHLFLQYTLNNGARDVTVFSASVPRNGQGRIRIIPILRRSYSLFSPAPVNALTVSAFNHIRTEEGKGASQDWLGNGVCYAALAGSHPNVSTAHETPGIGKPAAAVMTVLQISREGAETIRFTDTSAPRPMQWAMIFNRSGRLIKALHSPAPMVTARPVPETSAVHKTWSIPPGAQDGP
ncbi:MAG TPA: hypothetical protein VFI20_06335 [Terracidiphilus sp.]|nr:hypothetical protein [Terracidiphilus sp.]